MTPTTARLNERTDERFTPGPWSEGRDGNMRVYGPDDQGEHSGLIAVVYKGRGNARLIAAAPALHAAAQSVRTRHRAKAVAANFEDCGCDDCDSLENALGLAKGQS